MLFSTKGRVFPLVAAASTCVPLSIDASSVGYETVDAGEPALMKTGSKGQGDFLCFVDMFVTLLGGSGLMFKITNSLSS